MTANDIIAALDTTRDRAELLALLAPLRLSVDLPDDDRARVTEALIAAASRCWRGRVSG
jgi:hypothetical protein